MTWKTIIGERTVVRGRPCEARRETPPTTARQERGFNWKTKENLPEGSIIESSCVKEIILHPHVFFLSATFPDRNGCC